LGPLTERRMLAYLASGDLRLPAIDIKLRSMGSAMSVEPTPIAEVDAVVDVSWHSKSHVFLVECKTTFTPKAIDVAIGQAIRYSQMSGLSPMILVPYLSPKAIECLETSGISGVDLSGNGIVSVPGEMLVYKTGMPNKYPTRRKGPNPYRGATSIVARTLAVRREFESSRAVEAFIRQRGGSVTQGTVSKALDELEEDLVIHKNGHAVQVLQYEVLLDNLVRHYEPPDGDAVRSFKVEGSPAEIARIVLQRAVELGEQVVVTGIGSASQYTAMAQSPPLPIYCRRLDILDGYADSHSRFPNVSIRRMADAGAYYDARFADGWPWASPVQTYVELMNGGARDHEMADHMRRFFSPGLDGGEPAK
jgi:hypothetical protein